MEKTRREQFPLKQLPEEISVASSVLELERTRVDLRLENLIGQTLTNLLIHPASEKANYGAQVSVENDTSWVYIEETWDEGGLELYRTSHTGLDKNVTSLSILIRSPKDADGYTSRQMSFEVSINERGNISKLRVSGHSKLDTEETIPYITDLVLIKGMKKIRDASKTRFNKGKITGFRYKSEIVGDLPWEPEIKVTNTELAGNGYLLKRLEIDKNTLKYGSILTNDLVFATVPTVPVEKVTPKISRII